MNRQFMSEFFNSSGDEIFICKNDGTIFYKNPVAQAMYPKITDINKISHLFNFEICILKSEDIITYTPIYAALREKGYFVSTVTKQLKDNFYAEYTLCAVPISQEEKVIILRNDTNINLTEKYEELEKHTAKLEKAIINADELKNKLENQLLRTNLINLVSDKISAYISTKKIIKITLEQLKRILDVSKVEFSDSIDSKETKISSITDKKTLNSKLYVPIFQDKKIYGSLVLHKKSSQTKWQKDEIDLIKSICALLSTSFAKEELYKELENQKKELELTLTKLKNAQLQIVQSEKMASLGQLVAGIAHEINTPLGAISGNLELLETYSSNSSNLTDLKNFLNEISPINKEALRRIENMIKTLKNFSRLDEAKKKKVNILDGIKSSLSLLNHEIKNRIEIIENYEKIPEIYCYPDYINQVFMNLLLNACQSIKKTGKIEITAKSDNKNVIVSIKDTGEGISKANLNKIFDFGFTTKKFGQGTGLGLALAKKITDEHSGKIQAESTLGKGSTFTVILPIK